MWLVLRSGDRLNLTMVRFRTFPQCCIVRVRSMPRLRIRFGLQFLRFLEVTLDELPPNLLVRFGHLHLNGSKMFLNARGPVPFDQLLNQIVATILLKPGLGGLLADLHRTRGSVHRRKSLPLILGQEAGSVETLAELLLIDL